MIFLCNLNYILSPENTMKNAQKNAAEEKLY